MTTTAPNVAAATHSKALRHSIQEEQPVLLRAALALTRRRDDAADLVQETCLRALRAERGLHLGPFGLRPWLLTILRNVFLNDRSRRRRRREVSLDPESLSASRPAPADALGHNRRPGRRLDWDHVDERVKAAVHALHPRHRDVLLLWALEERPYARIAAELGIPVGTVMSRLHRARELVARSLRAPAAATERPRRSRIFSSAPE